MVPTACLVLSVLAPPDAVCLQQQQQLPAISHHDPSSTRTLSLSLSLSPSLTFCLALRASLLPHTTRYAGCYHTPRRTAPHRTVLTTTTPLLTTTPHSPHSPLTTDETRSATDLDFPIRTPAIHPSIHCCTTPTLDPLQRNRIVFVEASLQHTSGSTACIGTRHTRTKARQTR